MSSGATLNTATLSLSSPTVGRVPISPWHSPLPYLYGSLAAMSSLIAFALLVLACSYWKHSGQNEGDERDLENGEEKSGDGLKPSYRVYEEKVVVIMAGDEKPTYLATPMSSRASSFGSTSTSSSGSSSQETEKSENSYEKDKEGKMTNEEDLIKIRATQATQDEQERREERGAQSSQY